MYSLLISHQFKDRIEGTFEFTKERFLEYTSDSIAEQLRPLSIEAVDCIKSLPCVLTEEGRGEERAHIGRITDVRDAGGDIKLTIELCPSETTILNDDLWRIRTELDIEQFEFNRNHWAIKDRDLFPILHSAGHRFNPDVVGLFEGRPLPAPSRSALMGARDTISEWSHTKIDDFLLEAGVADLAAGRAVGSRRDRANAIVEFSFENPTMATAENSLFSAYIVRAATPRAQEFEVQDDQSVTPEVVVATRPYRESVPSGRSPNRVFVVHGQNDSARSAIVSFLENIGLVGIVLHQQPNMGRHLLTKFIEEAELVTFAIVLMTDDDVGGLKGSDLAPRARQNVILELGYFLSHLGQERVCALITPGLETPSDFDGIVYIRMDDDRRWQAELSRELLAAGMPLIDASMSTSTEPL